ncbi:MAG: nuclear transport factor 2 family protein [Pseudomonadota bacterium]
MASNATRKVAEKLISYCRDDDTQQALNELYDTNAVSIEAIPMPGADSPKSQGLEAIKAKHEWWYSAYTVHSSEAQGPYFHGEDRFAIFFEMDTTYKETGTRSSMKDIGIYTVANGKIIREEFYYEHNEE